MPEPTLAMMVLEFVLLTDRLHRHCSRPQENTEQHPPPRRPRLPPPSADDSIDATQQTRPRPRIH
jgi:hypothetical protein